MSNAGSSFVYVTYIRTTPERLWSALITPEFQRQYWYDAQIDTDDLQDGPGIGHAAVGEAQGPIRRSAPCSSGATSGIRR